MPRSTQSRRHSQDTDTPPTPLQEEDHAQAVQHSARPPPQDAPNPDDRVDGMLGGQHTKAEKRSMEDDQLKRGDRRAWEEAYRRYSQYLLCYILSYFLPLEDARDILQATFEILIKRAKDGRLPLVLLPGLLNRQARFLIATHLRDKGQPLRSPFPPLQDPPMKKQTEPVDSDEERILEADLKEKQDRLFEEALQKLPNSQRRVLQLTAQGLSTADIAASLGLREQTVRAQRSEGLQRIRRTIGHSDPFNRD